MSRYYFDLHEGEQQTVDDDGTECLGIEAPSTTMAPSASVSKLPNTRRYALSPKSRAWKHPAIEIGPSRCEYETRRASRYS